MENYQGRFGKEGRLGGSNLYETLNATPSPQEYTLPGMFDSAGPPPSDEVKTRRLKALKQQRALRDSSAAELARTAVFGYGCSLEEHRKYGLCLDGQCGRRGRSEDVILLTNKDDLFKGKLDEAALRYAKSAKTSASPMQAAVISGDFNRVATLVGLGSDINEIDPITRRSAIHEAVIRGYTRLVRQLCTAYAVPSADHPVHKSSPSLSHETNNSTGTGAGGGIADEVNATSDGSDVRVTNVTGREDDILGIYAKTRDVKVMRLDLGDCDGDTVFHYCARFECYLLFEDMYPNYSKCGLQDGPPRYT